MSARGTKPRYEINDVSNQTFPRGHPHAGDPSTGPAEREGRGALLNEWRHRWRDHKPPRSSFTPPQIGQDGETHDCHGMGEGGRLPPRGGDGTPQRVGDNSTPCEPPFLLTRSKRKEPVRPQGGG